jgi:outer membrane protein assembly factor BamA
MPMSGLGRQALRLALRGTLAMALHAAVAAQGSAQAVPTFAELEAAQARIGEIRVLTADVFDLSDPREDRTLFRWANALHIQTRTSVVERALLFKRGDPVSASVIEETERLLRDTGYLYDVRIRPVAVSDGVVDVEVSTRDNWSLLPSVSAGRAGGVNSTGARLRDYNLAGTGTTLSIGHSSNVDRSSNELLISNDRVFGTRTAVSLSLARNSDGQRDEVSIVQPFHSLDARLAAGFTFSKDDRIDPVYNAGQVVSEHRRQEDDAEVFVGWSRGRVDGWVQRYSIGMSLSDDAYAIEPGRTPPPALPADEKLVGPFLRYELIEDRYERVQNHDTIGTPEFFAVGFATTVQLGWASTGLGSSHEALLYEGAVSRGFAPAPSHVLLASASVSGQYTGGRVRRQRFGVQGRYYLPQSPRWLFHAAASADVLTNPDVLDTLLLGGDNGLRGYPLRYQSGDKRVLLTLEERVYTDLYVWRLFRVGGAAFVDVGRAWGGPQMNTVNPGWLADVGFGVRIVSMRTSLSEVLHIDIAFPLNATQDIKKVQLLVEGKASF